MRLHVPPRHRRRPAAVDRLQQALCHGRRRGFGVTVAGFGDSVGFGPTWLMMTRPRPPALRGARGRKRPGPLGPGGRMHFGVLVFDQVEELDFVGPWEMLGMWKKVAGGPEPLIVARSRAAVACAKG